MLKSFVPLANFSFCRHLHAQLLGDRDCALGQRGGERLVQVRERDLARAHRVQRAHAVLPEQRAGDLRRRHDRLVALRIDRVGRGRPDDQHLLGQLGRVRRRAGQRRAERAEQQVALLVLDQRLVDLRYHGLVAAVVELDQFDLALAPADRRCRRGRSRRRPRSRRRAGPTARPARRCRWRTPSCRRGSARRPARVASPAPTSGLAIDAAGQCGFQKLSLVHVPGVALLSSWESIR